jgi:hypothetical protein
MQNWASARELERSPGSTRTELADAAPAEPMAPTRRSAWRPLRTYARVPGTNLTVSPFGHLTANRLVLNVLDRIYRQSPLAPGVLAPEPG